MIYPKEGFLPFYIEEESKLSSAQILSLVNQILVFFLLVGVGFLARKRKLLNDAIQVGISGLILNISIPASILAASDKLFEADKLNNIVFILIGSAVTMIGATILSKFLAKGLKMNPREGTIFSNLVTYPNVAFIGYPVIKIFMPENGVFYASFFVLVFNLLFFIYGIREVSGNKSFHLKSIFGHINTLASLLMIVLYVFQVKFPAPIKSTLVMLGELSTPLSLIVIGSMMACISLKDLFNRPILYLAAFLKLIAIPTVVFGLAKVLRLPLESATVLLVMSALPSASTVVISAEKYNYEPLFASKGNLLSTMLFLLTIFYVAFLQSFL